MYQLIIEPTPDGIGMQLRCLVCHENIMTWVSVVPMLLVEGWGVAVYMIQHTATVHS